MPHCYLYLRLQVMGYDVECDGTGRLLMGSRTFLCQMHTEFVVSMWPFWHRSARRQSFLSSSQLSMPCLACSFRHSLWYCHSSPLGRWSEWKMRGTLQLHSHSQGFFPTFPSPGVDQPASLFSTSMPFR
jgi:hypothetical protein